MFACRGLVLTAVGITDTHAYSPAWIHAGAAAAVGLIVICAQTWFVDPPAYRYTHIVLTWVSFCPIAVAWSRLFPRPVQIGVDDPAIEDRFTRPDYLVRRTKNQSFPDRWA